MHRERPLLPGMENIARSHFTEIQRLTDRLREWGGGDPCLLYGSLHITSTIV